MVNTTKQKRSKTTRNSNNCDPGPLNEALWRDHKISAVFYTFSIKNDYFAILLPKEWMLKIAMCDIIQNNLDVWVFKDCNLGYV